MPSPRPRWPRTSAPARPAARRRSRSAAPSASCGRRRPRRPRRCVARRRVTLDRGRLLAVAPENGSELLVVTDTANNSATVTGRVELALRDVAAHLAGSMEEKGSEPVLPKSKVQVQRSLVARVQSGEAALGGARDQRLRASTGQEGLFSFGGQPSTARLSEAGVGAWADPGFDRKERRGKTMKRFLGFADLSCLLRSML